MSQLGLTFVAFSTVDASCIVRVCSTVTRARPTTFNLGKYNPNEMATPNVTLETNMGEVRS